MRKIIPIFILSLLFSSCSLDMPMENELTDPKAVASLQAANELLASAYGKIPHEQFILSLLSDDFVPTYRLSRSPEVSLMYSWQRTKLAQWSAILWANYYESILSANALLVRLPSLRTNLSVGEQDELDLLEAEALTLKAYCYLDLLQLFATPYSDALHPEGIILKDRVEREELARSSKQQCAEEIKRILLRARVLYAKSISAQPSHGRNYLFASDDLALTLLMRLGLYQGDYTLSLTYSSELVAKHFEVNVPVHSLFPLNLNDWQRGNATNALFALPEVSTRSFYSSITSDAVNMANMLLSLNPVLSIEEQDIRYNAYQQDSTLHGVGGVERKLPMLGKYAGVHLRQLDRFEVYQVRAVESVFVQIESLARLGREPEALTKMNNFLRSVHATELNANMKGEALIMAIMREKQREFAGEGLRYYDMKRLALVLPRFSPNAMGIMQAIQPTDYRWTLPIPASEYLSNHNLGGQNEGWDNI